MAHLVRSWDENPWTRVSFGTEFVLDPTGEILLTAGPHKHVATKKKILSGLFEKCLEDSLDRFARIRKHERGSDAEQAEIDLVKAEVQQELVDTRPCLWDPDASTDCTFKMLWQGEVARFEKKLSGIFAYPDPAIRREIAGAIGRYAERHRDEFDDSKREYLAGKLTSLLKDENKEVRSSAALALFRFADKPVPEGDEDQVIEAAGALFATASSSAG